MGPSMVVSAVPRLQMASRLNIDQSMEGITGSHGTCSSMPWIITNGEGSTTSLSDIALFHQYVDAARRGIDSGGCLLQDRTNCLPYL